MIKRSYAWILRVLLIALMLCALGAGAYADTGACICTQEMDPNCTCGCNTASAPSREQLLDAFLSCLFEAEDEREPFLKAHLYDKAQELWDTYLNTVYAELDAAAAVPQPSREELFAAFLETAIQAEAERDPARRAALYEQTERLWDAYMETAYNDDLFAGAEDEYCLPEYDDWFEDEYLIGSSDGPAMIFVTDPADTKPEREEEPEIDEYLDACADNRQPAAETMSSAGKENPDPEPAAEEDEYLSDFPADLPADAFNDVPDADNALTGSFGIPNPWTQTELLDEAVAISGVDFCPPAEESLPQNMRLLCYRALPGTLEADYTNGEEELMIRASTEDEGFILSGDYNTYSHEWEELVGGVTVDCFGDGEYINVAVFKSDDTAYALTMACGSEGKGLTAGELAVLADAILPTEETDIYADPVDIYADPKPQESSFAVEEPEEEKNGEIIILFTGNVRCGIDEGFGYAGLKALRDSLEAQGYTTILADGGNAVQGEAIGTLSKGMAVIDFMNALGYDAAIPGGHEFDFGVNRFLELAEAADFPYISCNAACAGEAVFAPYVMLEADGKQIAFIGVTVPAASELPVQSGFANAEGEAIVSFMQDEEPEAVYDAVQSAVESAREEGADLVCVLGNLGADGIDPADIIANTTGIDLFFDAAAGEAQTLVNRMGDNVVCLPGGEKLGCIAYSRIAADGSIAESGVWRWTNGSSAAALFGVDNDVAEMVAAAKQKLDKELGAAVTFTETALADGADESGRAETAIGDFCADALRVQSGADIGLVGSGLIRAGINGGDVRYGDILRIFPDSNTVRVIGLSGQQLLDILEWSCCALPEPSDSFPQVSGLSFEVRTDVESPCMMDEMGNFEIEGERRVNNVLVNGLPVDPKAEYTLACPDIMLLDNPAFMGVWVLDDWEKTDAQTLVDYIIDDLGGLIAEPEGQGRILIKEAALDTAAEERDIYLTEADIDALNELFAQYLAKKTGVELR